MRKYKRKIRKFRGSRVCGYGRVGQHRKTGQRVGRGKTTQWKKAMKSYYLKQKELGFPDPDWDLGKKGFRRPQDSIRLSKVNIMNIKELDQNIESLVLANKAKKLGNTFEINMTELNIQKILGRGSINKAINVSVNSASEQAKQKIEAAGGKVILQK